MLNYSIYWKKINNNISIKFLILQNFVGITKQL